MRPKIDIQEGDAWAIPDTREVSGRLRRVVAVFQGRVFYSTGGDTTRFCTLETFQAWCRKAELRYRRAPLEQAQERAA